MIGVGVSQNRVVGNVLTKLMRFSTAALCFVWKGKYDVESSESSDSDWLKTIKLF